MLREPGGKPQRVPPWIDRELVDQPNAMRFHDARRCSRRAWIERRARTGNAVIGRAARHQPEPTHLAASGTHDRHAKAVQRLDCLAHPPRSPLGGEERG